MVAPIQLMVSLVLNGPTQNAERFIPVLNIILIASIATYNLIIHSSSSLNFCFSIFFSLRLRRERNYWITIVLTIRILILCRLSAFCDVRFWSCMRFFLFRDLFIQCWNRSLSYTRFCWRSLEKWCMWLIVFPLQGSISLVVRRQLSEFFFCNLFIEN